MEPGDVGLAEAAPILPAPTFDRECLNAKTTTRPHLIPGWKIALEDVDAGP